jgi:lipopolysaccharide/colanic/teichoic acid biosynthesis glycosyltransferase
MSGDGVAEACDASLSAASVVREPVFSHATPSLSCEGFQSAAQTVASSSAKRTFDIAFAAFFLIALSPLLIAIAMTLKLAGYRKVIFWQERVGLHGRPFWFPKFVSMTEEPEDSDIGHELRNDLGESITFKMRADPRVTRIGRLLRILSLDELPQLWLVLRGDMSLVGPRPPLAREVERYSADELRRLQVKPGMTCLWQVSGRSLLPFDRQVQLDVEYVETWSVALDFRILQKTIPAVLSCRGAF